MWSDRAWSIILQRTAGGPNAMDQVWRNRFERIVSNPDLVLLTRDELQSALRDAFIEGRRTQRERSLEGTMERMGRAMTRSISTAVAMPVVLPMPAESTRTVTVRGAPVRLTREQRRAVQKRLNEITLNRGPKSTGRAKIWPHLG